MDYNKQTFDHVIRQSIKKFMKGDVPQETLDLLKKDGKEVKYTPEYFDDLEKDLMSDKKKEDKKASKKKDKKEMSDGGTAMAIAGANTISAAGEGYAKAYKDAADNTDKSKFVTPEPPRRR